LLPESSPFSNPSDVLEVLSSVKTTVVYEALPIVQGNTTDKAVPHGEEKTTGNTRNLGYSPSHFE
jgi:hypothetical protein